MVGDGDGGLGAVGLGGEVEPIICLRAAHGNDERVSKIAHINIIDQRSYAFASSSRETKIDK